MSVSSVQVQTHGDIIFLLTILKPKADTTLDFVWLEVAVFERKTGARGGHFPLISRQMWGAQMMFSRGHMKEIFLISHLPDRAANAKTFNSEHLEGHPSVGNISIC